MKMGDPHVFGLQSLACVCVLIFLAPLRVAAGGHYDILHEQAQRFSRSIDIDDEVNVPWYSRITRGEEDTDARDELQVTSVIKDETVSFKAGVEKWLSLSVGSTTYFVGLGSSDLTLLNATFAAPDVGKGHTYFLSEPQKIATEGPPLAATVFKQWNAETKTLDAYVVLAVDSADGILLWYRITSYGLEKVRTWPVHKKISDMIVFQVRDQMKLLMITPCDINLKKPTCSHSADIFEFSLEASLDPKLSHILPLESKAVASEVGVVGDDVYLALALPESGKVKLYRYIWPDVSENMVNGDTSFYGWFEFWKDLQSPGVAHAVFFHVSYKMYLAVGGATPALYRFVSPVRIDGCPHALQSLGFVSAWLILPVQTYRDEVVLLAEVHEIEGTKLKREVVALTWGGVGVFNRQNQPRCFVSGKELEVGGISCIIAQSSELGLRGAITLQLGDASVITVLVPNGFKPSALYRVNTQLHSVTNPLMKEVLILRNAQDKLKDEIAWQEQEMAITETMLLNTLNSDGSNIISADWVIQEVQTEVHNEVEILPPVEFGSDSGWTSEDHTVNIGELKALLAGLRNSTSTLLNSLVDVAVPSDGELHLFGYQTLLSGVEVTGQSVFNSLSASRLNGESVATLLKETVRIDQVQKIGGIKTFTNLNIMDIGFDVINNVPKDDLVFNEADKPVIIKGALEFTQPLHIHGNIDLPTSGTVGGLDLSEEIFIPGKEFQGVVRFDEVTIEGDLNVDFINTFGMHPRNLWAIASGAPMWDENHVVSYDSLEVLGQLKPERINGYLWDEIVKRIVWRDSPDHIDGLTIINGTLKSEHGMEIWQLNGLAFPNDYVLKASTTQHISGNKTILNQLLVGSVDLSNSIDGVPVDALVTLTTEQHLNGELKLEKAEIDGDVKVDEAVNGISLNAVRNPSPLIDEGRVVSSDVKFSDLEVEGPIHISGSLDGTNFREYLLDIVILPSVTNETVLITGKKTLQAGLTVVGPGITVLSGQLNEKKLSDIARIDAPQNFIGQKTVQEVVIENLHLTGDWDGVNVAELNAEAVRLTGIQDTSTHITFTGPLLETSRLEVLDKINDFVVDSTITSLSENVCDASSFPECTIRGNVTANVVRVAGSVVVNGKVCGWKLDEFEGRRFSRSRPQTLYGAFTFGDLDVSNHISVNTLNGISVKDFGKSAAFTGDFMKSFFSGKLALDELFIEGNIQTSNGVNLLNLAQIAENAIKLTSSNTFLGDYVFEDVVNVSSLSVQGETNGISIASLIGDSVLKNKFEPVTVSGIKSFEDGFIIGGNIVTSNINGLNPSKIITTKAPFHLQGPVRVLGNVFAGNINVNGLLNGFPVAEYQNRYKYFGNGRHVLKGDSHFLSGVAVDDLFVMNKVNKVNVDEFIKSVVMKNEHPLRISANKFFVNKVNFLDVAVDGLVNDIDLNQNARDVVLYNDELHNDDFPLIIEGRLTFAKTLTTTGGVALSENLDASELDGCFIKEWIQNAIFLAEPMHILGVKKFEVMSSNSDLKLFYINAVDLSKVIPLNVPQDIPWKINVLAAAVQHNLEVAGYVNGRILQPEFNNTLMITGSQQVTGAKTFLSGMTVQKSIFTTGFISGRDVRNLVTLQADETIIGPLKFNNMVIDGDLKVAGLISDLDVKKWNERAFLRKAPLTQVVSGEWNVLGNAKFMESVDGEGLLDGQNVHDLSKSADLARLSTSETQNNITREWSEQCHKTDSMLAKARAQPFLFQQLEVVQAISSTQMIASMHAFEAFNDQFLAVSYTNSCSGALYQWNRRRTAWELLDGNVQNMGSVQQWASLKNAGTTYLVTSAEHNSCPYRGGNVWRFDPAVRLRNVYTMDPWLQAQTDEGQGHLYLLGPSSVDTWRIEDGTLKLIHSWPVHKDHAQFVPRSTGLGLSVSDGQWLSTLHFENSTQGNVARSANTYLPGRSKGNVVTMKVADGRQLVAVAAEDSDTLVVYEDIASGHSLAKVAAHGAHSLSVMELAAPGRTGQTLLAFIEKERQLRVVQYKGVEGFVDVSKSKIPVSVKEMVPVRLHARGLVNQRHFLLLRADYKILLLEVEMVGDPVDEAPLNCSLDIV